jgi:hypothetical protein
VHTYIVTPHLYLVKCRVVNFFVFFT